MSLENVISSYKIVKLKKQQIKSKLHYDNPDRHIHICDPFSNNKTIRDQGSNLITNDLNPNFDSTYNLEANDFGELMEREGKLNGMVYVDCNFYSRVIFCEHIT